MSEKYEIEMKFKELNDNIEQFSSILEKFGLDLITKLGQTTLKLNKLTDKVNELSEATLDIKSLKPQLNTIIESQKQLKNEINLMQNLITNIRSPILGDDHKKNEIERDKVATNKKLDIVQQFEDLKKRIKVENEPRDIIKPLDKIKEDIFEYTGGHRILYEISQIINRINSLKAFSDPFDKNIPNSVSFSEYLEEKITFWINKLEVKD